MPPSNDERRPGQERRPTSITNDTAILPARLPAWWATDHATCDETCRRLAVPSPLDRPHASSVPCPWCGATAGSPCVKRVHGHGGGLRAVRLDQEHPSRREAAA